MSDETDVQASFLLQNNFIMKIKGIKQGMKWINCAETSSSTTHIVDIWSQSCTDPSHEAMELFWGVGIARIALKMWQQE